MRINIDLSPAVHYHAGLGRYAHELTLALTQIDHANEYGAFFHDGSPNARVDAPLDRLLMHRVPLGAKLWRMSVLLAYFTGVSMDRWMPPGDVFHATEHLLPPMRAQKSVFTIHDLIFRFFPEYHLPLNRWYLSLMLPRFLGRADAIIAVSENTRRDVSQLMGIPSDKISVIYEGVNPIFHPIRNADEIARVREKYHLPEKFILYFSTIEPRKNVIGLVDAFHMLLARDATIPDLVVAGRKGWLYEPVFQRVRNLGLESRVHFTDWIDQVDAPALISAAEIFVYPSLYEGFGLPPLEAMACGTPVICSNAASLPEVVGDAALLVNPKSANEISAAMTRVLSDATLRDELKIKGIARAAQFTWERAARETLAVYERVAGIKT